MKWRGFSVAFFYIQPDMARHAAPFLDTAQPPGDEMGPARASTMVCFAVSEGGKALRGVQAEQESRLLEKLRIRQAEQAQAEARLRAALSPSSRRSYPALHFHGQRYEHDAFRGQYTSETS